MKLVFESGPRAGQDVSVEPGRSIVIGRDPAADVFLDDAKVSRPHARLWVDANGGARIEDLKSTNGTFVNGQRIEGPTPLREGDAIGIGNTRFSVPAGTKAGAPTVVADASTVVGGSSARRGSRSTSVFLRESVASANRTSKIAVGVAVGVVAIAVIAAAYWAVAGRPLTNEEVIGRMKPSVVYVVAQGNFGASGGTGWVLDAEKGLIVTNNHVINGMTNVKVSGDGITSRTANVVASSPCDDVAVIHVDDKAGLVSAKLGSQDQIEQGRDVFALGYPVSLSTEDNLTVTAGTVSVVKAPVLGGGNIANLPNAVQHTAKIRPGNSGGPLVDRAVQVVGMNTFGSDELDLNYAVGIDRINEIVAGLSDGNGITWTGLGIEAVDADFRAQYQLPDDFAALEIKGVAPGTPADRAGLAGRRALILSIDGKEVFDMPSYCESVNGKQNGLSATFTFLFLDEEGLPTVSEVLEFR